MKKYNFVKGGILKIENSGQMLEKILRNKKESINFFKSILKLSITDIEFVGIEHFETIVEYEFSLLKVKLKYNTNEEKEVYLKVIKAGKIKESIFCFWSLLFEESKNENIKNNADLLEKTIITQTSTEENCSKIVLTLNKELNYSAEINLIELKNYVIEKNRKERLVKNLEINSEDILFIGIKNKR